MEKALLNGRTMSVLLASTMLVSYGTGAAAQQDGEVLPEISVQGTSYETEGSGSYTTDLISVGEKDVRQVREIPQSTTVLTRERLEDGGYTSLDTALRKTPGVVVLNNDDGRSSIFSRGFEFDTLYFNGLPAPLSSIYGTQPDMAIIDHVEILRGPAGLFAGSGEPAGAINMRLKQANERFAAKMSGTLGSWENKRGEIDVTGPLNESGTLRGRFVGAFQDQDSWVDVVENAVGVAYGTIQADLTENTTATFSISHMQRHITPFNGLPTGPGNVLFDIDRSTFTGADWNRFDNNVTDYIAEVEHRFDDGGHAKASARYSVRDVDFLYAYAGPNGSPADASGNVGSMVWIARDFEERAFSLDAHVSRPFELFGQEHNIIVGADYRSFGNTTLMANGSIPGPFNLHNWNSNVLEPPVNYNSQTELDPVQFGVYGQLRIKPVERLTLIGGGRLSWYDATTTNLITNLPTSVVEIDNQFTPYAGVVFDLNRWASLYGSFTEIFQPQTQLDVNGNTIDPRQGQQYEAGLKAELFDGGVNASIAYFNLRDVNRAVQVTPGVFAALGEVEVQGVELEASGEVLPGWQVAGGYTFTKTQYLNTSQSGTPFSTYTPEHMFQLWTKYSFNEGHGRLNGLYIGGGLKAYSSFSSSGIVAPGYVTVDMIAGYKINKNLTASLTVQNLFDEKYYARVGGPSVFNFYGEPRSVNFKLTAQF